jgi:VIT1/CCC1 family predicted Fe2+/Mn2+ transporter
MLQPSRAEERDTVVLSAHKALRLAEQVAKDPTPGSISLGHSASHLNRYSYGSSAAIVTSVGLIAGFGATSMPKSAVVSGLLIIALADNISDSLSIHIYQESENLEERAAFRATITNFVARLLVALSFVGIVVASPERSVSVVAAGWGMFLLGALTYVLSRSRRVRVWREITRHTVVAVLVVLVSRMLGAWIAAHVS